MAPLDNIGPQQWEEILERLTRHAHYKLLRLVWRGVPFSRGGAPPGGVEAGDLASKAIVDLLDGRRKWDPGVQPDLLTFLKGVVDSKVSHLVESVENVSTARLAEAQEGGGVRAIGQSSAATAAASELVIDQEALEQCRLRIWREIEGDDLAIQILDCYEAGLMKPAEMAEAIGVDVEEIYNAQKRLRRKVEIAAAMSTQGGKR